MKPKYLFLFLLVVVLAGCRKSDPDKTDEPEPPIISTDAYLAVGKVIQNNMVLQRDKPVTVWGTAAPSAKVTAKASWMAGEYSGTANVSGKWVLAIPASPANGQPQTLTISTPDVTPVTFENILIGDVWLCAGQSNMVMPIGNVPPSFAGVENYQAEIAAANYPTIRSFTVPGGSAQQPAADYPQNAEWKVCLPDNAANLSATAYFFARKLNTDLKVPIGIVIAAVNGSWCENWIDKASFQAYPEIGIYGSSQRSVYFNSMLNPLVNMSMKGFIWYQGENDQKIDPPGAYTKLNTALVKGWRSAFGQGDLPFYYVQLTPFDDGSTGDATLNYIAKFREAQAGVRKTTGTGMAVTMDAGEVANHHPKYKKQVGERLALLALNNTYGLNVQCVGPQYQAFVVAGNKVAVSFAAGTANGLTTIGSQPISQHFFIAGTDHVFRQGQAVINGDQIIITVPTNTPLPAQAVRYAFTNFPITNVVNAAGLPMEPFRTDDWGN